MTITTIINMHTHPERSRVQWWDGLLLLLLKLHHQNDVNWARDLFPSVDLTNRIINKLQLTRKYRLFFKFYYVRSTTDYKRSRENLKPYTTLIRH